LNPDNTIAFQTGWGNNITEVADTMRVERILQMAAAQILGTTG
jgi:hypothetical protein